MSTEKNELTYRRFMEEAMNKGNVAVLDELTSSDLIVHFLPPGTPPGPEGLKRSIQATHAAFPDWTVVVEEQFSGGDKIAARCTMSGTQRGSYLNHLKTVMPPSGKRFSAQGIDILRFDAEGKIAEIWSSLDRLGMLQQLGAIPAAGPSASDAAASTRATELQSRT